jgi:hypothetical protein
VTFHEKPRRGDRALLLFVSSCSLLACGATPVPSAVPVQKPAAVAFADDLKRLPRYHSKRLALSLPLPDGSAWRIDDHSRPELVATHAPTQSRIVVAVMRTDALVGRSQCEDLAHELKIVPSGDLSTLEDEVAITQSTFDTRIRVALETGSSADRPLVGHVMAFGGFLRKCFVFDFSTEVDGASNSTALSSRLAFARARILGGLELDPFGTISRDAPSGPGDAPIR